MRNFFSLPFKSGTFSRTALTGDRSAKLGTVPENPGRLVTLLIPDVPPPLTTGLAGRHLSITRMETQRVPAGVAGTGAPRGQRDAAGGAGGLPGALPGRLTK